MKSKDQSIDRSNHSAGNEDLEALIRYDESRLSMKSLLREIQTASDSQYHSRSLPLSVIRYRNTIDYILTKSLGQLDFNELNSFDRNFLRLAIYELRWLNVNLDHFKSKYPQITSRYEEVLKRSLVFDLDATVRKLPLVNQYSLKYSHPSFIVQTLLDNMSSEDCIHLLKSNNSSRVYYLRPNKLHEGYSTFINSLTGVKLEPDSLVPEIYRINTGIDEVVKSALFREGKILIQDKASILVVNALDPHPGQKVWDACAAPGMKTQLIAERMKGHGCLVASDVYPHRVKMARELSKKLNTEHTEWTHSDATRPEFRDADKILIDAPCTSTGILQSYPSFKWRLNKEALFALMAIQNKILDGILSAYSERPGTEIVYATCSILPHEGESQIDSALERHNIELMDPLDYGDFGYPKFKCTQKVRRVFPHKHECSGFFISRLRIKH
ncbi:MAG: hypothetical protein AM326_07520 [Candidatus Thorarchaeota archaeon SMTZ-45]|nr:MAG: hypothetical protein AM325_14290 [Candidatus Thorarchaeota archaeon SMTZ1-45]KXH76190.1 MAG: hypothetical protein AM326_07520 [Candidatus Thorarchaeota archaeon SMTZ-45]